MTNQHYWETINTDSKEGFDIVFSVTWEDMSPADHFESDDLPALIADIESGNLQWFVARVQAFKNGIELSSDYLGGCCYKSYSDFVDEADYYGDMVQTVISEAKQTIKALTEFV
jgi:hypothetical protein